MVSWQEKRFRMDMIDKAEEFYRQNFGSEYEFKEREIREEGETRIQAIETKESQIKEKVSGGGEKVDNGKHDEDRLKEFKEATNKDNKI